MESMTFEGEKSGVVNIGLSAYEANLFKLFREYQDQFQVLLDEGVLGYYIGSKTIHKNGLEILRVESKSVKTIK